MYKVVLRFSDGEREELDETFGTEAEAEEHGTYSCSCYLLGAEISHLSNPGDYPLNENDDVDFEVIEVAD